MPLIVNFVQEPDKISKRIFVTSAALMVRELGENPLLVKARLSVSVGVSDEEYPPDDELPEVDPEEEEVPDPEVDPVPEEEDVPEELELLPEVPEDEPELDEVLELVEAPDTNLPLPFGLYPAAISAPSL